MRRVAIVGLLQAGCLLDFDARLLAGADVPRLSAGDATTCVLQDDVPWCWGSNGGGQLGREGGGGGPMPIADLRLRSIATGGFEIGHSCGLDDDGVVWCWGTNGDAELGNGMVGGGSPVPGETLLEVPATHVAVGTTVGVVIDDRGRLWTWGWNGDGRLGFGTDVDTLSTPRLLEDRHRWASLDYGARHGCAIDADDAAMWCWGDDGSGKLGRDGEDVRPAAVEGGASTWRIVSAGIEHTCAIARDGALWCWGDDTSGQSGGASGATPHRVGDRNDWIAIAAGGGHSCGLHEDGTAWCWGNNDHGQLGVGIVGPREGIVQVGERDDWVEIACAGTHSCGRTEDGTLWCWGDNAVGQVGAPGFSDQPSPVAILEP